MMMEVTSLVSTLLQIPSKINFIRAFLIFIFHKKFQQYQKLTKRFIISSAFSGIISSVSRRHYFKINVKIIMLFSQWRIISGRFQRTKVTESGSSGFYSLQTLVLFYPHNREDLFLLSCPKYETPLLSGAGLNG